MMRCPRLGLMPQDTRDLLNRREAIRVELRAILDATPDGNLSDDARARTTDFLDGQLDARFNTLIAVVHDGDCP